MKKKFLLGFLSIIICLSFTGCGIKEDENNPDNNQQNNDTQNETPEAEIKLYSDDTKIVFDFMGVYKMVFTYSGNKITGHELYYDFGDSATAAVGITSIKADLTDEDEVESVKQNGRYVIIKYKESEYSDMTVEEIKATYSYLEELQKNN